MDKVERDKDIADDVKLELESYARQISVLPASKELPTEGKSTSSENRKRLFPKYDLGDDFSFPCGVKEFGFNENTGNIAKEYGTWLKDVYLPTFVDMPDKEHQYPLAVCFMLLNCRAVLNKKQCLPIPYFLGNNGSGKTELSKSIAQHYPREHAVEFLSDTTGAHMRDKLDANFGTGEVGLAVFDNFNPSVFMNRAGNFYNIILANNEESAISRISGLSNDSHKDEFKTYSYKIINSIFDLSSEAQREFSEIERRTIQLRFKEGKAKATRIIYDWEAQERIFQRIWGEENMSTIKATYGKALGTLARLNPNNVPIPAKRWVICQVPIAVGVYCGIFKDIEEGIAHFARHFEYLKRSGGSSIGSAMSIVLQKYIKEVLPEIANNPFAPKNINSNSIPQDTLKEYLKSQTGYDVSQNQFNDIIMLMANFGYNYQRIGTVMGFVKDTPIP
ncbi:MAG: hypothetical protein V7L31_23080 [Nostoc sp.]|uniref:hypothetical protein n=1 Tax=Nostoc sp. TaxID=1180 RepID=UPI002FF2B2DE